MSLKNARNAPRIVKDFVFGFIRDYVKTESRDVPVMVQYLCLNYLFIKEEFEIHNSTKLRFDDARYPRDTPRRIAMGKVKIGAANYNEEHQWTFTLLEVDNDALDLKFEIGILSMIKNKTTDLTIGYQSEFDSHHLRVEQYFYEDFDTGDHGVHTSASLESVSSETMITLPSESKHIQLKKGSKIEMVLNGHSKRLTFRFSGYDGYESFMTPVDFENVEYQMFVSFTKCKVEIDLTEYSCKVIEDGIVIE